MTRLKQITASFALPLILLAGCGSDGMQQTATSTKTQGEEAPLPSKPPTLKKKPKAAAPGIKSGTQAAKKEAIFVLGGAEARERFAAKFAQSHPRLPIWVSSGSPKDYAQRIFAKAGIKKSRVHLDYQAVDTVTNFTTLVDRFQFEGINRVYLITSDDHMRRARVIGDIVLGSRGIALKPVPVPSGRKPEPTEKCLRDAARAMLWLTTRQRSGSLRQEADVTEESKRDYSNLLDTCYR
ncbi:MAG: YdcF family protein [Cyanobacteriota bacterium]|nr:YdcF family protein [Cyanobacteriota bacterium]